MSLHTDLLGIVNMCRAVRSATATPFTDDDENVRQQDNPSLSKGR